MNKYEYKVFEINEQVDSDTDVVEWVMSWANERGLEGWHFFKLEWSSFESIENRPGPMAQMDIAMECFQIKIFAVGCRKI